MCRVLGVTRSWYYKFSGRGETRRQRSDRELLPRIRAFFEDSDSTYGSVRIVRDLRDVGTRADKNRIGRLMRENGLKVKTTKRFKVTTNSDHKRPVAPNLVNQVFTAEAPDRLWTGDITYIWTMEGWLYLAVILDLYSRRVVGWAMSNRIDQSLTLRALHMALKAREPGRGLIHHTDRGSQYAANAYQRLLKARGTISSMSRKGDCWDNAVAESFFATLKVDLVNESLFRT